MNLQFYLEKLQNSEEYKKFKKESQSAFLCSSFFSIDRDGNDNKQHFDFFSDGKIFSFQIENDCKLVLLENSDGRIPNKIPASCDFEFDAVEKTILAEMQKRDIKNKIKKILFSLQNLENKNFILATIFISGMGIISARIKIPEMEIVTFSKNSFFEMIRVVKKSDD